MQMDLLTSHGRLGVEVVDVRGAVVVLVVKNNIIWKG